jgi:hypothetical protein
MCKMVLTAVNGCLAGHLVDLLAYPIQNLWQGVPIIIENIGLFLFAFPTPRCPGSLMSVTRNNV